MENSLKRYVPDGFEPFVSSNEYKKNPKKEIKENIYKLRMSQYNEI